MCTDRADEESAMNMLKKAKQLQQLAMKNKDKVATGVNKATDLIDKKTGGKHTDKLKKLDDAANKFAGKPAGTEGLQTATSGDVAADPGIHPTPDPMPHPTPE
jgi:hypothetical protein